MSSLVIIFISVAVVGSGLAILMVLGEHGRWTWFAFLTLFTLIGIGIMIWGLHHMMTGVVYQSWRGSVAGWQLVLVGGGLVLWCGWGLSKEWRERQKYRR